MGWNQHSNWGKIQEFWKERDGLHINIKEMEAAILTDKSLAKPKQVVHLCVDNSTTFWYIKKEGGRLPHLNLFMRDFWQWCLERHITVNVELVKSEQDLADSWSRPQQDRGDYTLDRNLFQKLQRQLLPHINPQVNFFASPGNHQLDEFVSRDPHWQSWGWMPWSAH